MFTGLIRCLGRVVSLTPNASGAKLTLEFIEDARFVQLTTLKLGDSVAVNGACLTVLSPCSKGFSADLSIETLDCTTLGKLSSGDLLNLEPAMRLGDSLDGHLVSGHVDGLGRIREYQDMGDSAVLWFDAPEHLLPLIAAKGSIVVDGVSLTVNETDEKGFRVQLIEHTQQVTTFSEIYVDRAVNLEVDLIARYVARLAQFNLPSSGKIAE